MLSYARGPAAPLLETTIHGALAATAARCPDSDALVACHQGARFTFRQMAAEVESVAASIAALGLAGGDRIGLWATNCAEWVLLQFAASRSGVVLVNVNPAYRARDLAYVLRKSRMRALFLRESDARANYREILEEASRGGDLMLEHVVFLGHESWDRFRAGAAPLPPEPRNTDVANIQYTSGTTGSPKGVLLTHRNLVNNGHYIAQTLRLDQRDRICSPVPMYHCFGCVGGSMAMCTSGAAMILPAPQFDAVATMRAIEAERATVIYGVPTMFIAQLTHADFSRYDFSSLRTGLMAGAPCPIEVMRQVVDRMHCPQMAVIYGQTEASPTITGSSVDAELEVRVATVGSAFPNTEVKLVNLSGDTVEQGQPGELLARGYCVMAGYDGEAEATARAVDAEGWLHTGDIAVMRPDGNFRITGRARDMIIRGGENVYPREVEEFLYTHPKVADVQVVGLPDIRLGECVAAWIRLKPGESATEDEIRDFCRGQIAHFKIPEHIRFVEEFPLTVTGKVQKFKIRQFEIDARGLHRAASIETA